MNRLSEQERLGLEEVFLSISTQKKSILKEQIIHYQLHTSYVLQRYARNIRTWITPLSSLKYMLKTTTSHKNTEKL